MRYTKPILTMNLRTYLLSIFVSISFIFSQAQTSEIDSLSIAWQDSELSDSLRMEALRELITIYYYNLRQTDTAVYLAKEMIEFGKKKSNLRHQAEGWSLIGYSYLYAGHQYFDTIIPLHKYSLRLRYQTGNNNLMAEGLKIIGDVYYNLTQLDSSNHYRRKAAKAYTRLNKLELAADLYSGIAWNYYMLGDYKKSIQSHYKGTKLLDDHADSLAQVNASMHLARCYWRLGDLDLAEYYIHKATRFAPQENRKERIFKSKEALGVLEMERGNYQVSLKYLTEVIEEARKQEDLHWEGNALLNRSNTLKEMERYDEAIADLQRNIQIREIMGSIDHAWLIAVSSLADVYATAGRADEAIEQGLQYLEFLEGQTKDELVVESASAYHALTHAYEQKGEYQKALLYHQKLVNLEDSLSSKSAKREIARQE